MLRDDGKTSYDYGNAVLAVNEYGGNHTDREDDNGDDDKDDDDYGG